MAARSRALPVLIGVIAFAAIGFVVLVLAVRTTTQHVPSKAVLTLELAGGIPQRPPDSPLSEILGEHTLAFTDIRDGLVRAASDERIKSVRVKIGDLQTGLATAEEIRGLLRRLGEAGKHTTAFLDTAGEFAPGNLQYYLATGCQRVIVSPLGDVNLTGLAAREPFIRGTFDKLGIVPDFPGIGDYKTARNFYIEKDMTPADREMTGWLIASISSSLETAIAAGRGMKREHVASLIARGPFPGPDALKEKLIDGLTDWETYVEEVNEHGQLEEVSLKRYLRSGRPDQSGTKVAVIFAEGTILRGESAYSPMPLFGGDMMGAETLSRAWREVRNSDAKAVIFRINSPGGSAVASEIIRAEMERTAKKIPVVVSMGDVAASGGYWITCGAQRIVADPMSITASIGVFGGHFAMSKFWEDKLGVTWGRLDSAPNAAIYSSLEPWTDAQRAIVWKFLDRIYDSFVSRVSASRHMTREQVDAIGRGRVFTGEQAAKRGLVDEVGDFDDALEVARSLAGLKHGAPIELDYYPQARPVWQRLLERDDDTRAQLARISRALVDGETVPGPVWLPPITVR